MKRTRAALACSAVLLALVAVRAESGPDTALPGAGTLLWHVETLAGESVDSDDADQPFNPASIVKVATSLWALERLGPDHRFETRFEARGEVDATDGTLRGDLIVRGSGDPDFHMENAWLVAEALNRLEVRRVAGKLVVNGRFWIDWEGGSAGREPDPARRAAGMAARLRAALDPARWDARLQRGWKAYARRSGRPADRPPRIELMGGVAYEKKAGPGAPLVVHRSERLAEALRRLNSYSNNDIERIGETLGSPEAMGEFLEARWEAPPGAVTFATTSGLGRNRMTARQVVRLLRDLRTTADSLGVGVGSLLPVAGCGPGTLEDSFPELSVAGRAGAIVAKTGTLTRTDGGVAVLAGFVRTRGEELIFCVAAPRSGNGLERARKAQEGWVLELLAGHGGPRPRHCGGPVPFPEEGARVVTGEP